MRLQALKIRKILQDTGVNLGNNLIGQILIFNLEFFFIPGALNCKKQIVLKGVKTER
jgi:hypothetical protein